MGTHHMTYNGYFFFNNTKQEVINPQKCPSLNLKIYVEMFSMQVGNEMDF